MIDLTLRLNESATSRAVAASGNSSSSASANSSTSSQSFASELSAAISQALSQMGINPSTVQLTVDDTGSQNTDASQNSGGSSGNATTSNTASQATPVAVSPASSQTSSTQAQAANIQPSAAATQSTASDSPIVLGSAADAAYDAAYWAAQPAAVQQLQNIQDPDQRTQVATQLANEGYTIDVPIMVWGWDAGTTMQQREADGYTWVPSALQQPVTAAPGITGQGIVPYEPTDPPPGSIPV